MYPSSFTFPPSAGPSKPEQPLGKVNSHYNEILARISPSSAGIDDLCMEQIENAMKGGMSFDEDLALSFCSKDRSPKRTWVRYLSLN